MSVGVDSQRWWGEVCKRFNAHGSFLEQFGVRARAHKDDGVAIQSVDQQEVTTDMALAMVGPVPFKWMVKPFGAKRRIVGSEQQHRLLQPLHIVATRAREALPVF